MQTVCLTSCVVKRLGLVAACRRRFVTVRSGTPVVLVRPTEEVSMSTVYENTVDTLREVGERLAHDVPSSLSSVRLPSNLQNLSPSNLNLSNVVPSGLVPASLIPAGVIKATTEWSDDLTERVTGRRRSSGGVLRQHPVIAAGGALALVLAVVWFVRRSRNTDEQQGLRVAGESKPAGAA
jgi:hypothetical protein